MEILIAVSGCNEETKPNPLTIYSKTKFKGESYFLKIMVSH